MSSIKSLFISGNFVCPEVWYYYSYFYFLSIKVHVKYPFTTFYFQPTYITIFEVSFLYEGNILF